MVRSRSSSGSTTRSPSTSGTSQRGSFSRAGPYTVMSPMRDNSSTPPTLSLIHICFAIPNLNTDLSQQWTD